MISPTVNATLRLSSLCRYNAPNSHQYNFLMIDGKRPQKQGSQISSRPSASSFVSCSALISVSIDLNDRSKRKNGKSIITIIKFKDAQLGCDWRRNISMFASVLNFYQVHRNCHEFREYVRLIFTYKRFSLCRDGLWWFVVPRSALDEFCS